MKVILASASPRRKELLALIVPQFEVIVPQNVDERAVCAPSAAELAGRLAQLKCCAVSAGRPQAMVIGCDTVVQADDAVLGKPVSRDDAQRMLRLLSGRVHQVHTGVCLGINGRQHTFTQTTQVRFAPIADDELEAYLDTPEPYDKAGAYGIQGAAARFVHSISGCYFNVMGLPVSQVYQALRTWGAAQTVV